MDRRTLKWAIALVSLLIAGLLRHAEAQADLRLREARLGATLTITSRTDSGAGSLRQALLTARAGDTITFDPSVFPPTNPMTITLLAELPALTQGDLTIDASNAGVILDGQYTPAGTDGLDIVSDRNTVRGLQIVRFHGNGISIYDGAQSNRIGGNWQLGRAPRGEGNIITLNDANGIALAGTGTNNNTISGNLIGLDIDGTQDFRVQTLALSPAYAQDRTVFAGTRYQGVLKSVDAGATWTPASTGLTILDVRTLAVSPAYAADRTLFAGTAAGGVFRSTNGGASWAKLTLTATDRNLMQIAVSPNYRNDRTVFGAIHDTALLVSTDGGDTWSAPTAGFDGRAWSIIGIAFSPACATDHTVFAHSVNRIYKSTDDGRTWAQLSASFGSEIRSLVISPGYTTDRTLLAATRDCSIATRMWRSTDGGNHWQGLSVAGALCETRALAISPAFASDRTLFAADDWGGVVRSVDGGATWTRLESGRYNRTVVISPTYGQDATVLVGQYNGEMRKSTDKGASWSRIGGNLTEAGNADNGVHLSGSAQHNTIGGATLGERNVISNNGLRGVTIVGQGASYNRIIGNIIGASASGALPLGNDVEGIVIEGGAHHNQVGGALPGEGNVISANAATGVAMWQSGSDDNTVVANYIGTDITGAKPLGNHDHGVNISNGAQRTRVGGATSAGRNIISSNGYHGIIVANAKTADNVITGNYIGVDASGAQPLGNYQVGIGLSAGAHANTIGGATPGERNIVSANGRHGIGLWNPGTDENVVKGNYVGTDATGAVPLGNLATGVVIGSGAQHNRIGGAAEGERNIISGNGWDGILITEPGTNDNRVVGNYVGLDATGTTVLGQEHVGVLLDDGARGNQVGGVTASERNVIAGNKTAGIGIAKSATQGNVVAGNAIGVNASGTATLGNGIGVAFWEESQLNTITGNLIGGSRYHGIQVDGADRNTIQGNFIGTDAGGTADLGNIENGITLFGGAQGNRLGPDNIIAYNRGRGISIWDAGSTGNAITKNAIYGNSQAGIDLGSGGNSDLFAPAIAAASSDTLSGYAPVAGARVEIFSDESSQGRVYEGATTSAADGSFGFTKPTGFTGPNLTATATDADGNTSEFSQPATKPPTTRSDAYEPDDLCTQARPILTDGTIQPHTFHQAADLDWVWFDADAGATYVIQTANTQPRADTVLTLHDACPNPPLLSDDNAFGPGAQITWQAAQSGRIWISAGQHDPSIFGADTAYDLSVRRVTPPPIAIIVGGRDDGNKLWENIERSADAAYRTFISAGVPKDNLRYFGQRPNRDIDGNGIADDIAGLPQPAQVRDAIRNWAPARGVKRGVPFYLYLVDHGHYDQFLALGTAGKITTTDLDRWLSDLEATTGADAVTVIIEACRSGSFIDVTALGPATISRPNRVIIASTASSLNAYPSPLGAYFSDVLWTAIGQSQDLRTAFASAADAVGMTRLSQTPWLDDNGDAVADARDGALARRRGLGLAFTGSPPVIDWVQADPVAGGRIRIRAQVRDDFDVQSVRAEIYPPDFVEPPPSPDGTTPQLNLPAMTLTSVSGDVYAAEYAGFDQSGRYRVLVYAHDADGNQALPLALSVTAGQGSEMLYLPLVLR